MDKKSLTDLEFYYLFSRINKRQRHTRIILKICGNCKWWDFLGSGEELYLSSKKDFLYGRCDCEDRNEFLLRSSFLHFNMPFCKFYEKDEAVEKRIYELYNKYLGKEKK